ncbi:permease prefix domain 1-containing protein [Clostridium perfringens]|uniref:permease prefix domain 1-containing protein n=1 Tax=Clostridium perfringens TaxID=1502 RepID=UPI0018A923DE|nr:permease prefix domain 1-containing protein [Clostridium perfringens]MCC5421202.1 permease prefix domain 1-containing protein [Clostridium perfringens]MCC5445099.1 permease prefix domain 1-containing protein [Clostridium perfringens]MCC5448475.1 permease prefix domain 1-containing protein [Clostridium perfringens]MDB2069376.1 permease prefix domain 1-containing protein [Clostridium perfringens]MDM0924124.1 permease prefix domain 1-containing protein [Clostridium perfringens]
MREIDNYIDSLYKNIDGISKENKEIKETMRTHLIESVEELKLEGFSEKESIKIALERFGEINEIRGELKTVVERGVKPLLYTVGISLIILIAFFTHLIFMRFDYIKLLALIIIAVPMYIIIRGGVLIYYKVKGIKYDIDWKKELYKFLFANYFIFLVGWYIFPIEVGGSSNVNFQVDLIPFKSYIELMNRGITIGYLMKWIIIRLILFIPLGFYPAFLKGKFNNIAGCVIIASIVYFIVPILELILSFGLISVPIIYIGIDYWVISIIGVLLGYFLYNSIAKKHI